MEELRQRVLYLRDVTKLSFYQIADQIGISRKKHPGYIEENIRKTEETGVLLWISTVL